jgi:hypothetical protein
MLNETGIMIVEKLDRQNSLLSLIAEGHRQDVYADITQVANLVRNGYGESTFPIGDQIIIPWTDVDNSNTVYQVPLNIVHHGEVELETGEIVPGMFLQWHYCSAYGVQFSHEQAFINCPTGLAAGTYYVTLGASWGSNAVKDTSWSFTLTQAVPNNGRLSGFEGMPDKATSTWKVKSWATAASASPIEEVAVVSGATGTNLGVMNSTLPNTEAGINCMQRVAYGHNRWKNSALRQYLNKNGANWFTSQDNFDIRPNEYAKHGFLDGFGADFLAAIKPTKVTTALNTVEGFTATTETTFDKFFLPSVEQMNATPQLAAVEGPYFEYWRRRLGVPNLVGTGSSNVFPGYKIPAINAQTTAQYVSLRSENRGNAHYTWYVNSSGYVNYSYYDCNSYRFSPDCVIC